MNAIETTTYKAWQEKCSFVFQPQLRQPDYDRTSELIEGYTVISRAYEGWGENFRIRASENELRDSGGTTIYAWRNLNTDGAFCCLLHHANGSHYLVFRRDLYGYSVYEVESGREMHYIPSQSCHEDGQTFHETFIWTDVYYDPQSSLLAVEGCFWAAPFSVIVLDFSEPMQEQSVEKWFDVHELIDPEWNIYEDVEFAGWGTGELQLRALHAEKEIYEDFRLPIGQLLSY